ncbi:MAG TPA: peptidoglycan DD-metalloendopeptidase family protein, partial [Ignavibacteriaceae bacterium]
MITSPSKYYVAAAIILLTAGNLFSQDEEIKLQKGQLSSLKNEISRLEDELKSKTRKEKESYSAIENYSKQGFLLNKLIGTYRTEERLKENQIAGSEQNIKQLEENIKLLQDNYAKYVKAIYKQGQPNDFEMIVNASSVQQALLRVKYLEKFSQQRAKDIDDLKESREELVTARVILMREKEEKEKLAAEKEKERNGLAGKLDERRKILNVIKHDKAELKKDIEAKKQAEIKIKDLITNLIAEAERKKKEEADRLSREKLKGDTRPANVLGEIKSENGGGESSSYEVNLSTSGFKSFSALKGRLNWPISGGKIIRKYGENRNNKTNTIMLNYGVDIAASKDLNVKAVSEGVISAIDWIPGYGSVIIVTHSGDFRTVY